MKKNNIIKLFLLISFILLVIVIVHFRLEIYNVIKPFLLAIVVTYILKPLVHCLENKKINKSLSILLVYAFFLLTIIAVATFIIPELINNTRELINSIPEITVSYQEMFANLLSNIQRSNWSADVKSMVLVEIENNIAIIQNYILSILRKSMSIILQTVYVFFDFIIALIISYYFIKDSNLFAELFLSLVPYKWRNTLISMGREISTVLSNFVQGQLLTALIIGILEGIGLAIIRIKYAPVLGLLGGISNIIPYFGPFIGAIPSIAVALLDSPTKALWTVLVFVLIQQLDNAYISSKIIESKLGLHPVTVILVVLIGESFFGIPGMMLAVPVYAVLRIVFKRVINAVV